VPVTSHRQLVEVYGARVVCACDTVVWIKETNADDKQRTRRQIRSTTGDNVCVCGADALIGEDRLCQATSSESRLFHWVVPLCFPRPAGLQKVCTPSVS